MDNKLKRIEKRLSKLYRLQKRLEKKRKKLNKFAAKNTKKAAARAKKLPAVKVPAKAKAAVKPSKGFLWYFGISLSCALVATGVTLLVTKLVKRAAVQADAEAKEMDAYEAADLDAMDANQDYEKASLEELEEALLRVENQLDEVSEAIEGSKN